MNPSSMSCGFLRIPAATLAHLGHCKVPCIVDESNRQELGLCRAQGSQGSHGHWPKALVVGPELEMGCTWLY